MRKALLLAILYGLITGATGWLLYTETYILSKEAFEEGARLGYATCKRELNEQTDSGNQRHSRPISTSRHD